MGMYRTRQFQESTIFEMTRPLGITVPTQHESLFQNAILKEARRIGMGLVLMLIVLAGCATTGARSGNASSAQGRAEEAAVALTEAEAAQLARYRALGEELVVDELQPASEATFVIDPYTQVYEGYRIIRLLGLVDRLSVAEQYAFIDALFRDLPSPVAFAEPIRNIVVGRWFTNGEPLIVHVTQAFSGDQIPSLVAMFNTADGIRNLGYAFMQTYGPAVDYPRFVLADDRVRMVAQEFYGIKLLENGQVSASGAVGQDLPDFATIEDVSTRINLTDAYLRDGVRENDAAVVPVLEGVIGDETVAPLPRVHARVQLFMYYLFSGDLSAAQGVSDALQGWEIMDDRTVAETELAEVVLVDVPNILAIVEAFISGDTSRL